MMYSLLVFSLMSCLENKQEVSSSSNVEEKLTQPGITPNELEQYDIEEVASIYQEFAIRVNQLASSSDDSNEELDKGPLPPVDHKRRVGIRNLLKGLLDGPCHKNADVVFDRIMENVQKRIDHLSGLLLKAQNPFDIEKLKRRIEVLEELEKKLIEKKEDCANGTADCSDAFQKHLESKIANLDKAIEALEAKILAEQNPLKKEHLEKILERSQELKARLQELLSKC